MVDYIGLYERGAVGRTGAGGKKGQDRQGGKKKGRFHEESWVVRLESTIRVVLLGPQKPTACFHFSANYLQKGPFLPEYSPFESWGLY